MSRSLAEAIGDLGDVDNTSAAERHIVRRACVLIVGLERWNAGSPSRRGHAVLPDAGRRIVGRHHLDLDVGHVRHARHFVVGVVGFQDAAVPDGDLLPQHVAEGVDELPSVCVAMLRGCTARPASIAAQKLWTLFVGFSNDGGLIFL
jgi:hypothetical protein